MFKKFKENLWEISIWYIAYTYHMEKVFVKNILCLGNALMKRYKQVNVSWCNSLHRLVVDFTGSKENREAQKCYFYENLESYCGFHKLKIWFMDL